MQRYVRLCSELISVNENVFPLVKRNAWPMPLLLE